MSFRLTDQHIQDYHSLGYTVFRGILPPSLVQDLRRATEDARRIAREVRGAQAQRLQPVGNYEIDQQPFADYAELPEIVQALEAVLSEDHTYGDRNILGVLLEPAEHPYCTMWHRDWRDNSRGLNLSKWDEVFRDIRYFNQVNCALYEDTCTWVVPGSHLRRDLEGEIERFPDRPVPGPELEGKSDENRERACLEYCRSMPGAFRLHLEAGDFALYRSTLWHIGNYVPYRTRATLHDIVSTPEYDVWREEARAEAKIRIADGLVMENPNR